MNQITSEQMEQMRQMEAMKKVVIRKILTKGAIERLGRVKMVKPELAEQLELYLLQMYQSGQVKISIDDVQLKKILDSVTTKKKFRIVR